MNDTPLPSDTHSASPIIRISIPEITTPDPRNRATATGQLFEETNQRVKMLQQAVTESSGSVANPSPTADQLHVATGDPGSKKIERLIDSILQKFPLGESVAIVFTGCKTDAETDKVTADVARHLAERRVGKVLLVDANPNSQQLSSQLCLENSAGLGNVVCDDQPWQQVLQAGSVSGLDFLPYGNVSTSKTMRSQTSNFLENAKPYYQFICVSTGRNDTPLSQSFTNAADGIYLLLDLTQVSQTEAKVAADKLKLNNQTLVGCIVLDTEQELK